MRTPKSTIAVLFLFFLFASCMKNVDFNQVEDFSADSVLKSPILFFTLTQFSFLTTTGENTRVTDVFPIYLFDNEFLRENLEKTELEFRINNQFNRNFTIDFEFLDENNVITHSFSTFNIASNNLSFVREETILVSNNAQFLTSKKIRITVNLLPSADGSLLDPAIDQMVKVKLGGTYYFKI